MKKLFSVFLAALVLTGLASAASAFEKGTDYVVIEETDPANYVAFGENYPGSTSAGLPECTRGELLKGTVISAVNKDGVHCFNGVSENYNASRAYDGDIMTFAYPFNTGVQSWMGIMLDQPYELTEIRIYAAPTYAVNVYEQAIQGSNDGVNWHTITYFSDLSEADGYYVLTPEPHGYADTADYSDYWVGGGSYSMYRYINLSGGVVYGGAGEMEFYGVAKDAYEADDNGFAPFITVDSYLKDIEFTDAVSVSVDGSLAGTVIGAGGDWMGHAYAHAFDGDTTTFYDPACTGPACFTGIYVEEPTAIGEVRVLPVLDPDNPERIDRTETCRFQGSVDGVTWNTLAVIDEAVTTQEWITRKVDDTTAYNYFRYVSDGTKHGEAAELLLIPADAAADSAADSAKTPSEGEIETAPETFDMGIAAAVAAVISAMGYAAARKRK
ncbi:MAG: discoidin domain-containing protein [Ruminococcaceae bacterium]|nr:discoidin domain-containing protein [Oscillospiraceae bacterium]